MYCKGFHFVKLFRILTLTVLDLMIYYFLLTDVTTEVEQMDEALGMKYIEFDFFLFLVIEKCQ